MEYLSQSLRSTVNVVHQESDCVPRGQKDGLQNPSDG